LVLGPEGVGKTTVAMKLAGPGSLRLNTRQLQTALVERVQMRAWSREFIDAPALVLDGPVWLQNRPAAVECLGELIRQRAGLGRRTLVVQPDSDGSAHLLADELAAGELVVLGLRYPKGRRGRLRFARRICDELGIPWHAATGTDELGVWNYARVIKKLIAWKRTNPGLFDS